MNEFTFAQLRTQLDNDLGDTDDFTFTPTQKDEIVRQVIEDDPEVFIILSDTDTTIVSGTYSYDAPFDRVTRITYDIYGNGSAYDLGASYWEQQDDQIVFTYTGLSQLTSGTNVTMFGPEYYTVSDNIPGLFRSYMAANAVIKAVDLLMNTKINRFLRNETSIGEMQQLRNNKLADMTRLKRHMRRRRAIGQ